MSRIIKVGSRESVLAINQANIVIESIQKNNPECKIELITIKTQGDKILNKSLDKIGGKGLFIKELEEALCKMEIDIAVHSYKDMPYEESYNLPVVALSKRESPNDVLILPKDVCKLHKTNMVGTSSLRRSVQFKKLYEGFDTKVIRGNVLTRIYKLDHGEYSGLILAEAGLNRMSLRNRISRIFTTQEMIPSASQGILAVQGRKGDDYSFLSGFHNKISEIVSKAERRYLKTLNGGCSSPVAVFGEIHNNEILLTGMYVDEFERIEKGCITGDIKKAEELGEKLALLLKERLANK